MTETTTARRPRRVTSGRVALACGVLALVVSTGGVSEAAKLINGSQLKNNSVAGKKLKNDTVTGKKIKESSLKGVLMAGDVAAYGNASSTSINDFTTGVFTPIVSRAFTAPKNGVLYITGSVSAEDDISFAGNGHLLYRLSLDGAGLTSNVFAHELDYSASGTADSGAVTGVVPVTKGAHTVALDARDSGSGSFIIGREISVLFVPTGEGFTPPAKTFKKAQPQ